MAVRELLIGFVNGTKSKFEKERFRKVFYNYLISDSLINSK